MWPVKSRSARGRSGIFSVNFEYIWHVVLVFFGWLWTYKYQMECFVLITYIYLYVLESDLGALSHLRRSSMKQQSTAVSSHCRFLCHKELRLRCCFWNELNIWKDDEKSERYRGHPPMIECNLEKIWKTRSPRCHKNNF